MEVRRPCRRFNTIQGMYVYDNELKMAGIYGHFGCVLTSLSLSQSQPRNCRAHRAALRGPLSSVTRHLDSASIPSRPLQCNGTTTGGALEAAAVGPDNPELLTLLRIHFVYRHQEQSRVATAVAEEIDDQHSASKSCGAMGADECDLHL